MILMGPMMKLPEDRGVVTAFLCALVFYVITLMAFIPNLATNELFKTIATLIVGTAFVGGVVAFYFGNSKGGGDGNKQ